MGINWKWDDTYTTTTTTTTTDEPLYTTTWATTTTTAGEPMEIKAPEWKIGEKIIINSPITDSSHTAAAPSKNAMGVEPISYGWVCPKCGRVNAPWVSQCGCQGSVFKKIDTWGSSGIPEACKNCSNHPSNGGSGICLCTLGMQTVTCSTGAYPAGAEQASYTSDCTSAPEREMSESSDIPSTDDLARRMREVVEQATSYVTTSTSNHPGTTVTIKADNRWKDEPWCIN